MPTAWLLVSTAAGSPEADPARLNQALSLFVVMTIILGVLLVGVVLAMIAHRLRRSRRLAASSDPLPDPWKEAGQRAQPFDSRDEG
jgi:hypothetical protein